jgi:hypothetical protein
MMKENSMITKKIKCIHCGNIIITDEHSTVTLSCSCKKVSVNGNLIIEGAQGVDWVDVSPKLLNE